MDGPLRPAREIIRSKVSRRSARLPMELGLTSATLLATTPLELAPRGREPRVALEGNPGLVCRTALPFPPRGLAEELAELRSGAKRVCTSGASRRKPFEGPHVRRKRLRLLRLREIAAEPRNIFGDREVQLLEDRLVEDGLPRHVLDPGFLEVFDDVRFRAFPKRLEVCLVILHR